MTTGVIVEYDGGVHQQSSTLLGFGEVMQVNDTVYLNVGDAVSFAVDPDGDYGFDTTSLSAKAVLLQAGARKGRGTP